MAELALWLQLRKRSFHTVYQCRNATLNFHRYIFQVISQETCLIGTLSMESSIESDRVLNLYLEPININSVLIAFMVSLLDKSRLLSFSRL